MIKYFCWLLLFVASCRAPLPTHPHLWQQPEPARTVVLLSDFGTSSRIYRVSNDNSLAARLWRAGFNVYFIDIIPALNNNAYEQLRTQLRSIVEHQARQSVFVVGLGLGGTFLLDVLISDQHQLAQRLRGIITLDSPLDMGGATGEMQSLLRRLSQKETITSFAQWQRAKALLGDGLDSDTWQRYLQGCTAPLSRAQMGEEIDRFLEAVPAASNARTRALRGMELPPWLVILSPHDALFPPWQDDPKLFGIDDKAITRSYITRAGGFSREYGHLELLLHNNAGDDVMDTLLEWMERE